MSNEFDAHPAKDTRSSSDTVNAKLLAAAGVAELPKANQTHNYTGVVLDVVNGVVDQATHHRDEVLASFVGSAVVGTALRFAPPVVRTGAVAAGAVYGIYELGSKLPGCINDVSTVVNASSHTATEVGKAHAALERVGGGITDLVVGWQGLKLGLYAPEFVGAVRGTVSMARAGMRSPAEIIPEIQTRFANGKVAVDWNETPAWIKSTTDSAQARAEGLRSWLKPWMKPMPFEETPTEIGGLQGAPSTGMRSWMRSRPEVKTIPLDAAATAAEIRGLQGAPPSGLTEKNPLAPGEARRLLLETGLIDPNRSPVLSALDRSTEPYSEGHGLATHFRPPEK